MSSRTRALVPVSFLILAGSAAAPEGFKDQQVVVILEPGYSIEEFNARWGTTTACGSCPWSKCTGKSCGFWRRGSRSPPDGGAAVRK